MDGASTRDRLIEAGAEAMLSKSYHGVGIAEVLARADVPKGSFYHHFKSKEDFGVQVIRHYWGGAREVLRGFLEDRSRSPLQRLRAFFEEVRDRQLEGGCRQGCLLAKLGSEVSDFSPALREALRESTDHWLKLLAEGLREAQDAGELDRRHDPDCLAELLLAAWQGAGMRMMILQDRSPVDNFLTQIFDGLLS